MTYNNLLNIITLKQIKGIGNSTLSKILKQKLNFQNINELKTVILKIIETRDLEKAQETIKKSKPKDK